MSDKYEYSRVLRTGASKSGYLSDKPLSQDKYVAAQREKRLLSDETAEKHNASSNATKRRKKEKELTSKFSASSVRVKSRIVQSVRHHLSRGRDVTDIAIREMVMVSDVQRIVDAIKQQESK